VERSPGADVVQVERSPGADVVEVERSPGADVVEVEPSPGAEVGGSLGVSGRAQMALVGRVPIPTLYCQGLRIHRRTSARWSYKQSRSKGHRCRKG
jgi:hypothetical protein